MGRRASGMFTNFFEALDDNDNYNDKSDDKQDDNQDSDPTKPQHRSIVGLPILSPYSSRYHYWTMLINAIDATYTAFLVPIIVAFAGRAGDDMKNITTAIELLFGGIILFDIFLNLHVGFVAHYDYKKKVVMDGKHILCYYLKWGGAWIDVLSVTPFFYEIYMLIFLGFGNQSDDVAVLRLFRLLRIYRILKRIYGSSFVGSSSSLWGFKLPSGLVYLLSVIYSMLVMMNFLGCLLFYIADWESEDLGGTWVYKYIAATQEIPVDVSDTHEYVLTLIANHTQPELYLTSLYWAVTTVTTVGYGDISPNSFSEMIVLIFVMLSHIMLFGLLIGSISELVKSGLKSLQFKEETKKKKQMISRWMKYRKLEHPIVKKINSYYSEIERQSNDFDEEEILEELPISLRTEVIYKVTKTLMRRMKVFSGINRATLRLLAARLVPVVLPPGHELVRQGDDANAVYILERGQMSVLFNEVFAYSIEGPETCAEAGILSHIIPHLSRYPMTLRTFTSCTLWKLHSKDLLPVFELDPQLRDALTEGYRQRLMKSFGMGLRTEGLEKKVEASFGCKMSRVQAVQLRGMIERAQVFDGSFRQLVENVVTGKFVLQRSARIERFLQTDTTSEELSSRTRFETVEGSRTSEEREQMFDIVDRVRQNGEFGMVRFVAQLKKCAGGSGMLDFDELRQLSASLDHPLKSRSLLQFFILFDPLETDCINIYSAIDSLRNLVDFKTREGHVTKIFHRLNGRDHDSDRLDDGVLSLADLVRQCRVENHPEVEAGTKSTVAALNEIILSISHEDITLQNFINFHRDLSLCVERDDRFFELTKRLWIAE